MVMSLSNLKFDLKIFLIFDEHTNGSLLYHSGRIFLKIRKKNCKKNRTHIHLNKCLQRFSELKISQTTILGKFMIFYGFSKILKIL